MKYKILCSDLDGTLLSTKSDVSEFTISEINRVKETLKIILVSARMPQCMTYIQKDLGILNQPIICYNGALVLDKDKEIYSVSIDYNTLCKIHQLAEMHNIKLALYYQREWYVETTSARVEKEIKHTKTKPLFKPTTETLKDWKKRNCSAHKIMLMATKESADAIYPQLKKLFGDLVLLYRSNDTLIEIAPKTVSKLTAIKLLLNKNESMADVISFGDNYNDIEMLQHSGLGVAVANAREEVKAIANNITLKNTEHGVAHFLQQHLI